METNETQKLIETLSVYECELANLSSLLDEANLNNSKLAKIRELAIKHLERSNTLIVKLRREVKKDNGTV